MTTTEDRLAEIRARLEGVTPGPWIHDGGIEVWTEGESVLGATIHTTDDVYPRGDYCPVDDAEFIAHAPADIEWLLSRLAEPSEYSEGLEEGIALGRAEAEAERDDARARLAEAEATLTELKPDPVLVEGSWFEQKDLPAVLGNFIRLADERAREAKAMYLRAEQAEATIQKVRDHCTNESGVIRERYEASGPYTGYANACDDILALIEGEPSD